MASRTAVVARTRQLILTPAGPFAVALAEAAAAGLLGLGLFVIAVGRRDRQHYPARILGLAAQP
jgi:hypothetical protein